MGINYEKVRPDDFDNGLNKGVRKAVAHVSELQSINREERKRRIANLILETQASRQHQDPWMRSGTEPIGQVAHGKGVQTGFNEMVDVMIVDGLLSVAAV